MDASMNFAAFILLVCLTVTKSLYCPREDVPKEINVRCLNPKGEQLFQKYNDENASEEPAPLSIYCYKGQERSWLKLWTKAVINYQISTEYYKLYFGTNASDVYHQHKSGSRSHLWYLPWKSNTIQFELFNKSCIGLAIEAQQYTTLHLHFQVRKIDISYVLLCAIGTILYFSASKLSRNVFFYYGTGVSIGLLASLVIFAFVLSRFVPKKLTQMSYIFHMYSETFGAFPNPAMYLCGTTILILAFFERVTIYIFKKRIKKRIKKGGIAALLSLSMTISFWLIQYLWNHLEKLFSDYSKYIVGYLLTAGLLSFAVCYRRGPVTDPRTLDLMKWSIKLISLLLIYNGSAIPQASMAIIAVVILYDNFPPIIGRSLKAFWRRRFPPKIRLLTEEEYIRQGQEETRKALEELRQYCRSPKCDAWKTISRLESPSRFASFIEGVSHVSDEELLEYDSDPNPEIRRDLFTDDEDEIDFRLNSL